MATYTPQYRETESSEMRLFDCIEYRAEFRWIDVISEIAF